MAESVTSSLKNNSLYLILKLLKKSYQSTLSQKWHQTGTYYMYEEKTEGAEVENGGFALSLVRLSSLFPCATIN